MFVVGSGGSIVSVAIRRFTGHAQIYCPLLDLRQGMTVTARVNMSALCESSTIDYDQRNVYRTLMV